MTVHPWRQGLIAIAMLLLVGCDAAPGRSLGVTAAPTQAAAELGIECGEVAVEECRAVARAAVPDPATARKVSVEYFVAACIRAGMCMHPFGGWPWSHKVSVARGDGAVDILVCTKAEPPRCGPAPHEEAAALASVRIVLEGAQSREVQIEASNGTTHGRPVNGSFLQALVLDSYRISARFGDDPACPCTFPEFRGTPPPDWCSVVLTAESGHDYDLTITVADGRCAMELIDRGGAVESGAFRFRNLDRGTA